MRTVFCVAVAVVAMAFALSGGINWETIWLEPNPVVLQRGSSISYTVKGIHGGSSEPADVTHSQYLSISSSNPRVVEVDRKEAQLIGRTKGHAEIRIAFSECTGIIHATVLDEQATNSKN